MLKSTPLHGRIAVRKASDPFTHPKGARQRPFFCASTFGFMRVLRIP
jgi:hypothetical protein